MTLEERFWTKVERSEFNCWLWTASLWAGEYGAFFVDGRCKLAHRIAWEIVCGIIPRDLCVLHKCDNPACVNPSHLFLGTHVENMADMVKKDRGKSFSGSAHPRAKLKEADVFRIKRDSRPQEDIAAQYGVSQTAISDIKTGRRWSHLFGDQP